MANYSLAELQSMLRAAGFPENSIVRMAAIGIYESGGNPNAINGGVWYTNSRGQRVFSDEYSVGLYQINTKAHKNYSVADLKIPAINLAEALRIYQTQGLSAWKISNGKFNSDFQGKASQSQAIYNQIGGAPVVINSVNDLNTVVNNLPQGDYVNTNTANKMNTYAIYAAVTLIALLTIRGR